ncbi:MAG: hypothetical protein ABW217_03955 [Polyangiaceae bacterium]
MTDRPKDCTCPANMHPTANACEACRAAVFVRNWTLEPYEERVARETREYFAHHATTSRGAEMLLIPLGIVREDGSLDTSDTARAEIEAAGSTKH